MFDVVITGGTVIDGTGRPGRRQDVGIRDGRIVEIAESLSESGRNTIDADGRVVAPGFVDIHTHLDAQVFWDPLLTPSCLHGITTVVGGNCGFSIAPLAPEHADYVMRMLARVEGIPLESLVEGVPWSWQTMGEYLDAVDAARPALNMGFMAGHSAIRRAVMGAAAVGEKATPEQLAAMRTLLDQSLAGGALGLSSSWTASHCDGDGNPIPSRAADVDELVALCEIVSQNPGTQVEFIPCGFPDFGEKHVEVMTRMSLAANRPVNWNVLLVQGRDITYDRLAASDYAARRGAKVVALAYPGLIRARYSFTSASFDSVPHWSEVMALKPADKLRAFADPAVRAHLRAGLDTPEGRAREIALVERHTVLEGFSDKTRAYVGRTIGDIAREEGKDPLDVLLDCALADELRTGLSPRPVGDDPSLWSVREELWSDPRVIIGASDAGAHLDMLSTFDYTATFLSLVRDRPTGLTLEGAVARLTDSPARLYGLKERGRLVEGWHADITVFDRAAVGPGNLNWRVDLPAGAGRLYSEPPGFAHVLVGGVEVARNGAPTGERPGHVLRSGVDTTTVSL